MISVGGAGSKFPARFQHGMCDECASAELDEAKIAILFNNDAGMIAKWSELKKKFGK